MKLFLIILLFLLLWCLSNYLGKRFYKVTKERIKLNIDSKLK